MQSVTLINSLQLFITLLHGGVCYLILRSENIVRSGYMLLIQVWAQHFPLGTKWEGLAAFLRTVPPLQLLASSWCPCLWERGWRWEHHPDWKPQPPYEGEPQKGCRWQLCGHLCEDRCVRTCVITKEQLVDICRKQEVARTVPISYVGACFLPRVYWNLGFGGSPGNHYVRYIT